MKELKIKGSAFENFKKLEKGAGTSYSKITADDIAWDLGGDWKDSEYRGKYSNKDYKKGVIGQGIISNFLGGGWESLYPTNIDE